VHSNDELMIDTPEQIALELPLAGVGSRSLALVIDSLLQVLFIILVNLMLVFLIPFVGNSFKNIGAILMVLIPFFFMWGYFTLFEIFWNGQTPGKRLVRIRIISDSGRPITPAEAIGRNLVRIIDMLPGVYAVGLICMLLNRRNKRLGDYVAGTIAVYDKKVERVSTIWNPGIAAPAADPNAAKISPEELVLIETYLNRRLELEPPVRKKTAAQVAALIQSKLGVARDQGQSDDAFLETVARQVRDAARYR
jgi:uncharacterized RDD family membrane protein YckC